MASAEFCSLDLPMDNFDLLELLSVPFPLGSGDLNLMARRSGLLDTPSQASDVGTYLACQPYPVHCVTETQGPLAQAQQLQFQIPNVCPVKASDYACHSQSAIPQPSFPQPSVSQPAANQQTISQQLSTTAFSAKQSDVPPPQHSAHIGTPTQVLICCCIA